MEINAQNVLLIGSVLLFVSIVVGKAGSRFGIPVLLLFLAVGMLFGSDGIGIHFNNPAVAQFIGVVSLSIILFTGGMDTKYQEIRPVMCKGLVLATVGVVIMTLVTGLFIYFMASGDNSFIVLSLPQSMLLAALMSSTDSASVFSILRAKKMNLKDNVKPLLELESGSNDPMAYMLVIILMQIVKTGDFSLSRALFEFAVQMVMGALCGFLLGKASNVALQKINVNEALRPVLLLALVFFIFSFTDMLGGNGYLAVYLAGLLVGNSRNSCKESLTGFFDGLTWLFQIAVFLVLGLLVNPNELVPVALFGICVGLFMIFVSRPVSVFISLSPFRNISFRTRCYVSWVGLRGAVPIIFATYPLMENMENASYIFNVVFFITIMSLLVQGTTVGFAARKLSLSC